VEEFVFSRKGKGVPPVSWSSGGASGGAGGPGGRSSGGVLPQAGGGGGGKGGGESKVRGGSEGVSSKLKKAYVEGLSY